jgi:hypothetical protein
VIGKVTRGRDVRGLLRYLFGSGRRNEHTRPHLVAGWDEPAALEPAWSNGRADTKPLATLLEQPLRAANGRLDDRPVWQCSVRAAPEDRVLGDQEWEQVARDVVVRTGFASEGDDDACRWVAIRHADDHIHLVVTLARQDGRPVTPRNDYYRVGEACRAAEKLLNLRATAPRDRTAASQPSDGEREKANRNGMREPARITLRRQVRTIAAASDSVDDFLDRLRGAGVLVRARFSEKNPGEITGYAVALADSRARTAAGDPVWYGGGKLAADLSLPKLLRRWQSPPAQPGTRHVRLDADQRAAVWAQAQKTTAAAAAEIRRLARTNPAAAADVAWAASDALSVTARIVEGSWVGPLTRAADAYDRAARELWGRTPVPHPTGTALRTVARVMAMTGRARRDESAQLMALVVNLIAMTQAVAQLREAQDRAAQAAAARSAAEQLRAVKPPRTSVGAGATRITSVGPPGRPDIPPLRL